MRLLTLSLALGFFLVGENAASAQTPAIQKEVRDALAQQKAKAQEEQKTYTFEMNGKKWDIVLEWLVDQTGRKFISNIRPAGTFNFVAKQGEKYTMPQIMDIINDGLLSQKMIMLNRGSSFIIVAADEKIDPALVMRIDIKDLSAHGNTEIVSTVYVCKFLVAEDTAPEVKKQMGPFGEVIILHKANQLILQDTAGNLKRIKKLLDDIDKAPKLENLLGQALKNNPDIRVAESKLREAEAELNRARLLVTQKVTAQQREIAAKQKSLALDSEELQRMQAQLKAGIPQPSLNSVEANLQKLKADLARLEAELQYLLGTASTGELSTWIAGDANRHVTWSVTNPPVFMVQDPNKPEAWKAVQNPSVDHYRLYLDTMNKARTDAQTQSRLPGDMSDKLRKALDTQVSLDFVKAPPKDVLAYLQQYTKGFNIVEQVNLDKAAPVTFTLKEPVPVGAVFQFLEDHYGWRFVVREYGIVIAEPSNVPQGAVHLQDFWKNRPTAATKK